MLKNILFALSVIAILMTGKMSRASTSLTSPSKVRKIIEQAQKSHTRRERVCFDPTLDPAIANALKPQAKFHETQATIDAIHNIIWKHRRTIDPRLIYFRILGESQGDPYAVNPSSGAYGLFQFLGKPYGSRRTHRQIIEKYYRKLPRWSPRLIQVKYYLEQYVEAFKDAADEGYGCNRHKTFSQYSNLEKSSYLGWGSCTKAAKRKDLALCASNQSYRRGACAVALNTLLGRGATLCD